MKTEIEAAGAARMESKGRGGGREREEMVCRVKHTVVSRGEERCVEVCWRDEEEKMERRWSRSVTVPIQTSFAGIRA